MATSSIDLLHERASLWESAKGINDAAEAERRNLTAEEQTNWDQVNADIAALDARIERAQRLESMPAAPPARRPIETPEPERRDDPPAEDAAQRRAVQKEAFRTWLMFGMGALSPEQRQVWSNQRANLTLSAAEQRALSVGVDTAGGYLVPDEMRTQIEQAMLAYGGMRESGATIFTTDGGQDIPFPTGNDTGNKGRIIGENTTVTQTDPSIGQKVLRAFMYSSDMVLVPFTLLQDSAIDVESYLAGLLAERLGRITNEHFTSGVGADRPSGIVTDATSGVTAASATEVTADELIDLEHSVDRAYRPKARWMLNDTTLKELRKLKDGDGRYIWQPGLTVGAPNSLNGYLYVVNNDMPNTATGEKAVLFGDFARYYIRDVKGVTMFTLRERFADSLQVGVFAISRHDGKLVNAGGNPVKAITMA